MTLLETVIATVILSLAAIGVLELFEQASRSASDADEWVAAIAYAEEGIEAAKIGQVAMNVLPQRPVASGFSRQVSIAAAGRGFSDIVVTVSLPRGGRYVLHRLVATP
ncbi:MAG TPA: hypothetical protein VHM24_12050 [Gemmatimonadaceae bacterium]|nr:hypothetical protein [Gemmatimonadaceae bacterium]